MSKHKSSSFQPEHSCHPFSPFYSNSTATWFGILYSSTSLPGNTFFSINERLSWLQRDRRIHQFQLELFLSNILFQSGSDWKYHASLKFFLWRSPGSFHFISISSSRLLISSILPEDIIFNPCSYFSLWKSEHLMEGRQLLFEKDTQILHRLCLLFIFH